MTRMKLQIICAECSTTTETMEIETYPAKKEDNLDIVFRWLFQMDWRRNGLGIICPACADKETP